jgi:hypothetical protein
VIVIKNNNLTIVKVIISFETNSLFENFTLFVGIGQHLSGFKNILGFLDLSHCPILVGSPPNYIL